VIKAVNTGGLEALVIDAAKRGYNRQLDLNAIDRHADPDGIHLLQDAIVHTHKGGKVCEPHFRCRVLVKQTGRDTPVEVWLDVETKRYQALPDAVQAETADG
jgi:hypothetical protein